MVAVGCPTQKEGGGLFESKEWAGLTRGVGGGR